jgi:ABC-type dipeptide/oligopeptide/nickel transport system ATPase subunit
LIDQWIPRRSDNSRIFDAKSKPSKFSGGEQRLLSVLATVAMRPNTDFLIIDEPLNNLDFVNARNISNMINKVIQENSKLGILMISHCRIFPFITREIKLTPNGIIPVDEHYVCHSCFGEHNSCGFYE